jgi:hypothetical protein
MDNASRDCSDRTHKLYEVPPCVAQMLLQKETYCHYSGDEGVILHLFNRTGTVMKIHTP